MASADTYVAERAAFRSDPLAIERTPAGYRSGLGYFWLAYGILRLACAVLLIVYSGTVTLMFGALLSRVPDPFVLMNFFHLFFVCAVVVGVLAGLFSLVAGWSLLSGGASRHKLAIIAALLSVSDIPFGTTLGAYTLAVFSARL
jgi:hypothetical protein